MLDVKDVSGLIDPQGFYGVKIDKSFLETLTASDGVFPGVVCLDALFGSAPVEGTTTMGHGVLSAIKKSGLVGCVNADVIHMFKRYDLLSGLLVYAGTVREQQFGKR